MQISAAEISQIIKQQMLLGPSLWEQERYLTTY